MLTLKLCPTVIPAIAYAAVYLERRAGRNDPDHQFINGYLATTLFGFLMISPLADPLNGFFHRFTGLWNLEDMWGLVSILWGSLYLCAHVMHVQRTLNVFGERLVQTQLVGIIAVWMAYLLSDLTDRPMTNLIESSAASAAYWIVMALALVGPYIYLAHELLYIATEKTLKRRTRRAASLYAAAAITKAAGCVLLIAYLLPVGGTPAWLWHTPWVLFTAGGMIFAYAAHHSWRTKKVAGNPPQESLPSHEPSQ